MDSIKICIAIFSLILFNANPSYSQTWTELGGKNGLAANEKIEAICSDSAGNIYAAGSFTNGASPSAGKYYVAKWNKSTWNELGGVNGIGAKNNNAIFALCSDKYGNIYAGGAFSNDSGKYYVAKWDGISWSELGGFNSLKANGYIETICAGKSGSIYAAGMFTNGNRSQTGNHYVAKWNGSTWVELGGPGLSKFNGSINSIFCDTMENIYAAGEFYNDSLNYYVAKWDGNSWSELGGRNSLAANEMILSISGDKNGNVFAAGLFTNGLSSQTGKNYVAKWNGLNWSELGGRNGLAANATIQSIQIDKNNNVYAAGIFTNDSVWPSGKHYVAVWNGSNWSEVGGRNALSANSHIADICVDFSNQLYAAGSFTNENSVSLGKKYVAKFSGSSVGIKNEITEVGLSVFPNPVQTQLKVWNNRHSLHGSYLIISDMLGRKVLEFSITESSSVFSIPVQELKNGAYILSLQKEGETSRMKFVKE